MVDRLAADHAIRMSLLRTSIPRRACQGHGARPAGGVGMAHPVLRAPPGRIGLPGPVPRGSQENLRVRTTRPSAPAHPVGPPGGLGRRGRERKLVLPGNKTYHQNHPIIAEMFQKHGSDLDFAGVILANEMSRLEDKERSAQFAAKLVRLLGAEGAVINQEGGGNTVTDVMILCRLLSSHGVKTCAPGQ